MKNIFLFAALAPLLFSGTAHAVTLDITLGLTPGSVSYSLSAAPNVQDINLASPSPYSLALGSNSFLIDNGVTVVGQYVAPTGDSGKYLAVLGGGSSTLTLEPGYNQLGFTWGTIDTYNTLTITDSRSDVYHIKGAGVSQNPPLSASIISALYPSGFVYGTSQADVRISDPFGSIVTAQFSSSINSFEVGGLFGIVIGYTFAASSASFCRRRDWPRRFCLLAPPGCKVLISSNAIKTYLNGRYIRSFLFVSAGSFSAGNPRLYA